jgi:hypothetical protein
MLVTVATIESLKSPVAFSLEKQCSGECLPAKPKGNR